MDLLVLSSFNKAFKSLHEFDFGAEVVKSIESKIRSLLIVVKTVKHATLRSYAKCRHFAYMRKGSPLVGSEVQNGRSLFLTNRVRPFLSSEPTQAVRRSPL